MLSWKFGRPHSPFFLSWHAAALTIKPQDERHSSRSTTYTIRRFFPAVVSFCTEVRTRSASRCCFQMFVLAAAFVWPRMSLYSKADEHFGLSSSPIRDRVPSFSAAASTAQRCLQSPKPLKYGHVQSTSTSCPSTKISTLDWGDPAIRPFTRSGVANVKWTAPLKK